MDWYIWELVWDQGWKKLSKDRFLQSVFWQLFVYLSRREKRNEKETKNGLGAGVTVGSAVAGTASTDKVKQHPLGTLMIAVLVTLP